MSSILQGELAAIVAEALADANVPVPVTITRTVEGGPGANPWDPPTEASVVDYVGRGWIEAYSDEAIDGTTIAVNDLRVMLLTATITIEPVETDELTVEGKTYSIITARHDASGALYVLQARK